MRTINPSTCSISSASHPPEDEKNILLPAHLSDQFTKLRISGQAPSEIPFAGVL